MLFPALHDIVSWDEYDALGEEFEAREKQLFGADGYEKIVARMRVTSRPSQGPREVWYPIGRGQESPISAPIAARTFRSEGHGEAPGRAARQRRMRCHL